MVKEIDFEIDFEKEMDEAYNAGVLEWLLNDSKKDDEDYEEYCSKIIQKKYID